MTKKLKDQEVIFISFFMFIKLIFSHNVTLIFKYLYEILVTNQYLHMNTYLWNFSQTSFKAISP